MQRYILGRVIQAIISLLVVTIIIFLLSRLAGDPLVLLLDENATFEDRARLSAALGLDKPLVAQYGIYMSNLIRGDMGESIVNKEPVVGLLVKRATATLQLAVAAMVICLAIAVPVGVFSAVRRGTFLDRLFRIIAILGQSLPAFWLGLMLMFLFGVILGILPTCGSGGPLHLILPAITLGWYIAAGIMRLTRTSMLEVLRTDYIQLARTKGVSETAVIWKHAFKNAALPVLTFSVILFIALLGGAVVTETVFAWPGLGQLLIKAVRWRDFPVVQGIVLLMSGLYIFANLMVDISYGYLNPKIRYGGQ